MLKVLQLNHILLWERRRLPGALGRIVIVRYGQNFRGIKAMLAQERCVLVMPKVVYS